MRLNHFITISALFLTLFLAGCHAHRTNKILESEPVSGFEQVGPITVYNKTNLFDFMNGEVVVYFPLGFRLLYAKAYVSEETDAQILVEIYDMGSPEGSRDVYEYYNDQGGSFVDGVGEAAWADQWLVLFSRHIHFVRLSPNPSPENPERPTHEEMLALARQIDALLR